MKAYIALLRPVQWVKNLFVFLPLFFGGAVLQPGKLWHTGVAFVMFCLVSSSIYILNDLRDVAFDRLHPEKCRRPIAAGTVSARAAIILHVVLLLSALLAGLLLPQPGRGVLYIIVAYYVLNVAYSLGLKRIPLLDVMIVATGFVLRVMAGARAACVVPSHWIMLMTFLLALFLVLAKRRDDVLHYEHTHEVLRSNVASYNREFLNAALTFVAAVMLVCYIMYTVDEQIMQRLHCRYVYATSVFVLAGLLRYLQLSLVDGQAWSPTRILLRDRFLQVCVLLWLLSFAIIIYG